MHHLRLRRVGLLSLLSLVILASLVAHAEERALVRELISLNGATPRTHPATGPVESAPDSAPDPSEGYNGAAVSESPPANLGPMPRDFGRCRKTAAQIDLQATMVATSSDQSLAVTTYDGVERLVREGDSIAGRRVAGIRPRWLILVGPQGYECLRPRPRPQSTTPAAPPSVKAALEPTGPASTGGSGAAAPPQTSVDGPQAAPGIRPLGKGRYAIDRDLLTAKLADLDALRREGSATFHRRNGDIHGVRVTGVRARGLFAQLGVRRGDIIKTVNGELIDGPMKVFSLYDRLQDAGNVRLGIERKGRSRSLEYIIR